MHLLNILWRKKDKLLIVLLSATIAFLIAAPVLKGGLDKVFYSVDPEVMYVANALLFIKNGLISYADHPGTPAIVFISYSLIPFRFIAKYIEHSSFITFIFNNLSFIFIYLRILQSGVIFVSLLLAGFGLRLLTKSILPVLLLFLMLLSFSTFYFAGTAISAEPLTYLIISFWLLLLTLYLKDSRNKYLIGLCFLAGFSFANRATNLFTVPASLVLILFSQKTWMKKFFMGFISLAVSYGGFLVGIMPLRRNPVTVFEGVFKFANSTGIHLTGEHKLFDLQTYISSVNILLKSDSIAAMILLSGLVLAIISLVVGRRVQKILSLLVIIFSIAVLIYAKFPMSHYQNANYFIISFVTAILAYNLSKKLCLILILVLLFFFTPVAERYINEVTGLQNHYYSIEESVKNNPSKFATVWDWWSSRDFAYLWIRDYSIGLFDEELSALPVKIYQLDSPLVKIETSYYEEKDIFDVCWDRMYVQQISLDRLTKMYPKIQNMVQEVPNTNLYLISSSHCRTKS